MNIPKHVGIICDGNRRFARALGEEPWKGHEQGADKIQDVVEWCLEFGIKYLTLWLFSTENFARPEKEKEEIFKIAKKAAKKFLESSKVHENKIRLTVIGNLNLFPQDVREEIQKAVEATKTYNNFFLNVAIGYGGKEEILDCVKQIAKQIAEGKLKPEDITKEILDKNMYSATIPDVDLVIRTSGEQRTSGFLIWKTDYAEFYFSEKFWPEFEKEDFLKAIMVYSERERRFGR